MVRRLGLALVLALGCAGPTSAVRVPACPACDLDVDDTRGRRPAPARSQQRLRGPSPSVPVAPAPARYHGKPIDLNVNGADVHDVLRTLARVGNSNIVVAGDVKGSVTMSLHRVPWDQALATIVAIKGLRLSHRQGVYLITTRK